MGKMTTSTMGAIKSSLLLGVALYLPSVMAHAGFMHPAVYGWNGDPTKLNEPLHSRKLKDWWFHGQLDKGPPPGTHVTLPAGGSVTLELACEKRHSTAGGSKDTTNNPCPDNPSALHAGVPPQEAHLRGCGIAIAYKSNAKDAKPEEFVIISVIHKCIIVRNNQFQIPAGLPKCPGGKCICAFFWQGFLSNDEMYMNGFDCVVENAGNKVLAKPQPARPCHGNPGACVKGAKLPMYWANLEGGNVKFNGRKELPSYMETWGFKNGAQTDIFVEQPAPGGGPGGSNPPGKMRRWRGARRRQVDEDDGVEVEPVPPPAAVVDEMGDAPPTSEEDDTLRTATTTEDENTEDSPSTEDDPVTITPAAKSTIPDDTDDDDMDTGDSPTDDFDETDLTDPENLTGASPDDDDHDPPTLADDPYGIKQRRVPRRHLRRHLTRRGVAKPVHPPQRKRSVAKPVHVPQRRSANPYPRQWQPEDELMDRRRLKARLEASGNREWPRPVQRLRRREAVW